MNVRLGRISQVLAPAYSVCRRCQTAWLFVQERPVWCQDGSGQFALCEKCWDETTLEERLKFHRSISQEARWAAVKAAVCRESGFYEMAG